jgi:hypothetical protein
MPGAVERAGRKERVKDRQSKRLIDDQFAVIMSVADGISVGKAPVA